MAFCGEDLMLSNGVQETDGPSIDLASGRSDCCCSFMGSAESKLNGTFVVTFCQY